MLFGHTLSDDRGYVHITLVRDDTLRIVVELIFKLFNLSRYIRDRCHLILNLVILLQKLDREETLLLLRNAVQLCCYTIDHGLYFRCKFMYGMECVLLLCDGYRLLCRLLDTGTLQGRNLNNLAAETLAQLICVDLVAILLYDVHHVDCHDHRNAELHDLCGQIQVTLDVCSVNDIDDCIRTVTDQIVSCYHFLQRVWRKGIDTRKVHDDYILMSLQLTFFFLDRNTRPVTYKLIGSGQRVEQSSLTAVRVAGQCDFDCHFSIPSFCHSLFQ